MEAQFHGANCITIATKNARITIDDNLVDLGAKSAAKTGDIALFTNPHSDPAGLPRLIVDLPGEYEVGGILVYGISARGHVDEAGKKTATMYKIVAEDVRILVTGHIYPELSESQLEAIGTVDVMLVPVGGNGYTLDGVGALALIKKVEPKVIIPTHYADGALHFPVPQNALEEALTAMGMEAAEAVAKLRFKPSDLGGDTTNLVVLERS